ncbi:glutathione S-transferase C-terminal domain-containing protein [Rhizobium sp. BK251]|uniref:glutathione S-transferase family protein n=1 Tax=Rhizobium sp. BK251 TaxID=2512125 RepID=UPI0010437FA5|nr:glutathione S-transferase C-terminal domain-containing protein [Rhizobium sp. BK251]TCL71464.1 glutathione S-transferase [Rhizobium sp. BK251]
MKLYIADDTCSRAVQLIANEIGLTPEIVHYDVFGRSASNGDDFAKVNPLLYVPALSLDNQEGILAETTVVISYLADQHPEAGLIPAHGTLERAKLDQLLVFMATEIAQKHIPLMRKLLTVEGIEFTTNKLLTAYKVLDDRLADGRPYLLGDKFSVADAYAWATLWVRRSGVDIGHLKNFAAWKARIDARPAAIKALQDEAEIVAIHRAQIDARAA